MKYTPSLLIKFIIITGTLWVFLGFMFQVSFVNVLITSITLTGASFIIGDLYLLPKIGNIGAAMVDFVLAFGGIWILGSLLFDEPPIRLETISLVSAVAISLGEILVHWYINKQVAPEHTIMSGYYDNKLLTEYSDELELDMKKKNKRGQD